MTVGLALGFALDFHYLTAFCRSAAVVRLPAFFMDVEIAQASGQPRLQPDACGEEYASINKEARMAREERRNSKKKLLWSEMVHGHSRSGMFVRA
ncbi:MAG: hypothetical protein ACKVS9_05065 [Phycisphaerae bacterium]